MKKILIIVSILLISISSVVFASSMLQDVYLNEFAMNVNGKEYISQMPILNYQGRTYLPLREFGDITGINVDFQNNTIIVDNFDFTNTKFFLYDAFMLLDNLSKIDKNINSMLDAYVSFLGNTDPYATSNITNLVNANSIYISTMQEYEFLHYFKVWGTALGLDNDLKISTLYNEISNYITNATIFNQTILDAMYLKTSSDVVSAQWSKLYDDYYSISTKLTTVVLLTP
jgi:hypothetical protein